MTPQEAKDLIRPMLADKRYHHSLCVAKEAVRLAKRYGADEKKAELAGLLHDITKEIPADKQLKMLEGFAIILRNAAAEKSGMPFSERLTLSMSAV